jgi:lipoate-protein ligase A
VHKPIETKGFTDLTIGNRKFSGNSQRRRLRHLMFHGTILLHLDLSRVERYLRFPSKQPEYRKSRGHGDFIMNLKLEVPSVKQALASAWKATVRTYTIPSHRIETLVDQRYGIEEWTWRM